MKLSKLTEELSLQVFHAGDMETEVTGVYCGDLLSWVMGKARPGQIWCTIMSNQNVAAVAALNDLACVLLTEDVKPDTPLLEKAQEQNITLLGTPLSTYSAAFFLHNALDLPLLSPEQPLARPRLSPEETPACPPVSPRD